MPTIESEPKTQYALQRFERCKDGDQAVIVVPVEALVALYEHFQPLYDSQQQIPVELENLLDLAFFTVELDYAVFIEPRPT